MEHAFDERGHLTQEALCALLPGGEGPDALTRLEVAEHLSFCDGCLLRYTALLGEQTLLAPPQPAAPGVMRRLRERARIIFINQYVPVAAAAGFALLFWVTGAFTPLVKAAGRDWAGDIAGLAGSLSQGARQVREALPEKLGALLEQFELKGVFDYEQ